MLIPSHRNRINILNWCSVMIYRGFAQLYSLGDFPEFSAQMAQLLPSLLEQYHLQPSTILDIACGEGTFAILMAKRGYEVTGIDRSPEMLTFARKKAQKENLNISFHEMDMRHLELQTTFDLVTCWYDSLNYILNLDDLEATFTGVAQHLNSNGYFVFDMNTIHWLTTLAQRYAVRVERETNDIFQVHRHSYDENTRIAVFHIIGFLKENDCWIRRVDEHHHQRGYTLDEIRHCLNKASLTEIASWGNLEERLPVSADSKRVWFFVKKDT